MSNYVHIRDYRKMSDEEKERWSERWPNFQPYELASRDFSVKIYKDALDALQGMRTEYDSGLVINSAWRNDYHNKIVGGKENSDHTWVEGREINASAFDVHISSIAMGKELEMLALKFGFNVIGRYRTSSFIHISMREPKKSGKIYQWGRW